MKLRLGLVGLGDAWQSRYLPALRALADRFEVRAVFDEVARRAELAATELGASVSDGFGIMPAREDIDAILVLSAGWCRTLPVLAACNRGKSVYLGAGLDLRPEEASTMHERVKESGIAFMVEFPRRHSPATLRLKELIATVLGPPRLLFCHHRQPLVDSTNYHRGCPRKRSTAQELVELVDWCRYVVGKDPRWVTGMMQQADGHQAEYRMMSLDFSDGSQPGDGPVAQISCGRYIPGRWSEAITYRPVAAMQVSCERGIAFVDPPHTVIWFDEAGRHQESLDGERPVGERLLVDFFRAVTSLVSKTCDLEDCCRALSIVDMAGRSHREGRRLRL